MDLTVEGKAYINGAFEPCCIGITDGKISAIKKILKAPEHRCFGTQLILPAGVDMHVHFRDPGFTQKEDFFTGSKAAAFGGISCVFDMPNTQPQTKDVKNLREKCQLVKSKSVVDFGLYAGVADDTINRIHDLAPFCNGFKIYLGSTTNSLLLNERALAPVFHEIIQTKKLVLIHAESNDCLNHHILVENDLKDHLKSHPAQCEEQAIKTILRLAEQIPVHLHICHLSSCEGVELIKTRPSRVSVGVTPHHLLFDVVSVQTKQSWYKVNPPIRTSLDRETLWSAMNKGRVDVLESDHAPHTREEKDVAFNIAPSGVPGVETMYPLFLAEVKRERLGFNRLISLVCEKPAALLGIPKGKLEVGRDADFIVVDWKEKPTTIHADKLHSKCMWTPFEGRSGIFPTHVFVRGEPLVDDSDFVGKKGYGRQVKTKDLFADDEV